MGNGKYFWDVNESISFLFLVPVMRLSQKLDLFRQIYFDPSFSFSFLVLLPTPASPREDRRPRGSCCCSNLSSPELTETIRFLFSAISEKNLLHSGLSSTAAVLVLTGLKFQLSNEVNRGIQRTPSGYQRTLRFPCDPFVDEHEIASYKRRLIFLNQTVS